MYDTGLRRRGHPTLWLSDAALDVLRATASGNPGGQRTYADIAIEAALTIRMVFHLPLRQTEGFLRFLAHLLKVDLPIPDHTTFSRRLKKLNDLRFHRRATDRPIHLLIDSTGLRIHVGHLRKPPKNRAWRKMHLAIDARTGKILASDLTGRRTADCARVPMLLEQIDDPVASISADGADDALGVYEAARAKGRRTSRKGAHSTWAERPTESRALGRIAREEPKRPPHQKTRPTQVAHALRPQHAQPGGKCRLPIQDDHRSKYEESHPPGPTSRGATRDQNSQYDDPSGDADSYRVN